jgi:hypothetical protein
MTRSVSIIIVALFAFLIEAILFPTLSFAQLRASIQGVWVLESAVTTRRDGSTYETFGARPRGLLIFDAAGRYSLQIVRRDRPRFASGERSTGTDAENRAAVIGTNTHFGIYSVNELTRTIAFKIGGSSFPNWDNTMHWRRVTDVDAGRLQWTTVEPPEFLVATLTWRRP